MRHRYPCPRNRAGLVSSNRHTLGMLGRWPRCQIRGDSKKGRYMGKKVIHKFKRGFLGGTWGCDTDGVKEENTAWRWKDVTCTRCLKRKKEDS